jgi:hypothetical protein
MTVRFEDALASLPAAEQAAIQARFEGLRAEYDRDHAAAVEALREAKRAAHAAARAVIQARRTRDADLPQVGSFHG